MTVMAMGQPGTEPEGIAGDCFYVLGMYDKGDGLTVRELQEAIAAENAGYGLPVPTRVQVSGALNAALRKRGLVAHVDHRWSQTPYGLKMLDVWVGTDEPRPSGLGWPPHDKIFTAS